jgi:hypothetical protein
MAASSTDYFTKVGSPGTATTLSAPGHSIGGTSITVVSTDNHPTDTGYIFAMDTVTLVNGEEVRNVGSYTEWEGIVGGATSITNMVLRYGTDQNYPAGATTRVYIPVAGSQNDRMVDGLLIAHDQDGTLKADSVIEANILDNAVTTSKIADLNSLVVDTITGKTDADSGTMFGIPVNNGVIPGANLGKKGYCAYYKPGDASDQTTTAIATNITNASASLVTNGGALLCSMSVAMGVSGQTANAGLYINSTQYNIIFTNQNSNNTRTGSIIIPAGTIPAGTYTVLARFGTQSGSVTGTIYQYNSFTFSVVEI